MKHTSLLCLLLLYVTKLQKTHFVDPAVNKQSSLQLMGVVPPPTLVICHTSSFYSKIVLSALGFALQLSNIPQEALKSTSIYSLFLSSFCVLDGHNLGSLFIRCFLLGQKRGNKLSFLYRETNILINILKK